MCVHAASPKVSSNSTHITCHQVQLPWPVALPSMLQHHTGTHYYTPGSVELVCVCTVWVGCAQLVVGCLGRMALPPLAPCMSPGSQQLIREQQLAHLGPPRPNVAGESLDPCEKDALIAKGPEPCRGSPNRCQPPPPLLCGPGPSRRIDTCSTERQHSRWISRFGSCARRMQTRIGRARGTTHIAAVLTVGLVGHPSRIRRIPTPNPHLQRKVGGAGHLKEC